MESKEVYKVLASAFVAEGVDTIFLLIGDANMYWATEMAQQHDVRLVHARHENSAVAMAEAYARITGRVGISSVTCGPGFTPTITSINCAANRGVPLVIFAGEVPLGDAYHLQITAQKELAEAAGAKYFALHSLDRLLIDVREAFHYARQYKMPVVIGIPNDLQLSQFPWRMSYIPSSDVCTKKQRIHPDDQLVSDAVEMIEAAERPIIIAGQGARDSDARDDILSLSDRIGAYCATSLRAKGYFFDSPYNLDIAGSFSEAEARRLFANADLVIGVGAGLGFYTTESGYLYPNAKAIQIDTNPRGLWQGLRTADLHIQGDAKVTVRKIVDALPKQSSKEDIRSPVVLSAVDRDPEDTEVSEQGTLHPQDIMRTLDRVIPKDWDIVVGCAHFFTFVASALTGRSADRYHFYTELGAIGQALPGAFGTAATRGDGKVVLIEGDGSLLYQLQEYEAAARQEIKFMSCVFNDGAYGAEVHKLVPAGVNPKEAIFGRADLARLSRAFGLGGHFVNDLSDVETYFEEYMNSNQSMLLDFNVAQISSKQYKRLYAGYVDE